MITHNSEKIKTFSKYFSALTIQYGIKLKEGFNLVKAFTKIIIPLLVLAKNENTFYLFTDNVAAEWKNFVLCDSNTVTNGSRFYDEGSNTILEDFIKKHNLKKKPTYRKFEFFSHILEIECFEIRIPNSKVKIQCFPWFVLPSRPYPIFVYALMIILYDNMAEKSFQKVAEFVGEFFKIKDLNKSTVKRTYDELSEKIKTMQSHNKNVNGDHDKISVIELLEKIVLKAKAMPSKDLDSILVELGINAIDAPKPINSNKKTTLDPQKDQVIHSEVNDVSDPQKDQVLDSEVNDVYDPQKDQVLDSEVNAVYDLQKDQVLDSGVNDVSDSENVALELSDGTHKSNEKRIAKANNNPSINENVQRPEMPENTGIQHAVNTIKKPRKKPTKKTINIPIDKEDIKTLLLLFKSIMFDQLEHIMGTCCYAKI